ncbi:hypothetical protein V1514DRAFT_73232 [Lipomyces japonicus]|uniref:uncharacterized protein n=1 Tax=Lipomyces japonicus TaxID=56871 RepID=UPI0034CF4FD7
MFAVTPAGLQNAVVTKHLLIAVVTTAVVTTIVGIKHYVFLQLVPHVWSWHQWWRLIIWQFVYLNQSEVLFASLLIYNTRGIERLLGSRKFASMVILAHLFALVWAPVLLIVAKIIPGYAANYLPPGPTPVIFAILALYHDLIPSVYKFRFTLSPPPSDDDDGAGNESSPRAITLSDKVFVYALAAQLALSQLPGSLICALTGWIFGILWARDILPGKAWRLPLPIWRLLVGELDVTDDLASVSSAIATGGGGNGGGLASTAGSPTTLQDQQRQQQQQQQQQQTGTTPTANATPQSILDTFRRGGGF